jgi:penicillin-binding protein 1A
MGLKDTRKKRRAERLAKRAQRSNGPSAAERAEARMHARANGEGDGDGGGAVDSGANGGGNGDDPRRRLTVLPGGGGGDDDEPRLKPKLKKLRALLVIIGLSLLALVSWIFGIMMAVAQDLPKLENRAQYERAENSVVYDREGNRLATLTNNEGRILVESDEIAPVMKEAVVAIEDQRFYDHRGVDFQGIARALYQDVLSGSASQGASTITQQFVKNALAAQDDRTIFQKLREAALAYQLERNWSKDKIITEYLNSIYFGEGAYGIEAAARTFFGYAHEGCGQEGQPTCASELLPYEAALLAGIIASPDVYSPRANPETSLERRNLVLSNMADQGFITSDEYAKYSAIPLPLPNAIEPPADDSAAPYFTSWLRQQLVDKYGAGEAFGGGLEIKSTLDLELQQQVESIAESTVSGLGLDSSVVVLDNETAGVLAMVGGFDYEESAFNLATNGLRQPGSAFKPFTLVTALEQGHSTSEVYESAPQSIPFKVKVHEKGGGNKIVNELFEPANYEDSYLGSASLATGTTYSDNSVYAQVGMQAGPENVAETAARMGINTDLSTENEYAPEGRDFAPYNPALILGGLTQGVSPLEMAHAYNTLEEDGNRITGTLGSSRKGPVGISEVREDDDDPNVIEGDPVEDKDGNEGINESIRDEVISPETAETATSTLATVITSGTGERAATSETKWGKTGTTDNNGDAWFCGATDDITACVWVGHADSNQPMLTEYAGGPVDGGTFPAEIFADVVNAYLSLSEDESPEDTTVAPPTETETPVPTETVPAEPIPTEPAPEAAVPEETAPAPEPEAPAAEDAGAVSAGRER